MKGVKLFVLIALAVGVSSCCSCRRGGKSQNMIPLAGTQWQLVQMDGRSIVTRDDNYTIAFDSENNRISGKSDCNRVMGPYELSEGSKISFGMLAGTRMMCPDQASEDKFMKQLQAVTSYNIDGNMLLLFENGDVKLVFTAIGTAEKQE